MAEQTLEERVAALEQAVTAINERFLPAGGTRKKDWRRTVGMFENDPIMKEIDEEGRKIREADRRAAERQCDDDS